MSISAPTLTELRDQYESFLRNQNWTDRIVEALDDAHHARTPCPRVKIRMAELREQGLAEALRNDPLRHLRGLEAACHAIANEERPGYDKNGITVKVAIEGPIASAALAPRQLNSLALRRLVCVEGVATKVSAIKPKIVKSVHYCPETRQHQTRDYVDATDPQLGLKAVDAAGMEQPDRIINITSSVLPTVDKDKRPLETEFGLSYYKDYQSITLQEMPEKAPMGQLPRSVELVLDYDLVDRIKPGDRVMITGVYRALATTANGQQTTSGVYKTVILVNHVQTLGRGHASIHYDTQDLTNIKSLAARTDILDILGRSISPSIHGHNIIKKAIALQLLSGVEKNLVNGTHLRGDINILMVGDPSTAKSQLLRSAMNIAPLAVSTTGKGSSGVGLTAAVTSDPDTRERRLEAGAMVLADGGLVCVDEFDKMGENDRVAIHEAMEQQTVTIAKAGIHASLNARCSVLAAANPVYGQYDRRRRIQENIGLPDSLLSRFDLLFVVLDQMDPESDRRIASHVIQGHRYVAQYDDEEEDNEDKTRKVWQRNDETLHLDFLRKFLHYCKTRIKPVLTEEARHLIATRYAELRSRQDERTLPITARSLETIIRLSTAHAKARLSPEVLTSDVHAAMDILSFALYHENVTNSKVVSDDEAVPTAKRARVEPVPAEERPATELDSLMNQVWEALKERDGIMDLGEVLKIGDSAQAALDALETQGRVQVSEDYVVSID